MARVAVVTDSNAYLAPHLAQRLGIHVLPHTIHMQQGVFKEGQNLTASQYYRLLAQSDPQFMPKATGPSLDDFLNLYTRLHAQTDQIISLHVSSHLSDTVATARAARRMLLGRYQIEVIDSQSASVGLGMLVQAAAVAAQAGRDLEDCIRLVRGMMPHIYLFFLVKHLSYLEREQRISPAQAVLGSMLRLMPLLQIEDGEIIPLEKVRSSQRGLDKLYNYVSEFAHIEQAAVVQQGFSEEANDLLTRLKATYPQKTFPVLTCNPSLAVHIGPAALGVVVFERIV